MHKPILTAAAVLIPSSAFAGNPFVTDYNPLTRTQHDAVIRREQAALAVDSRDQIPKGTRWQRFFFDEDRPQFGDVAIEPFGQGAEYDLNAVNYNIRPGEGLRIPFQVFLADLSSGEDPEKTNEEEIQDPTQGLAVRFPVLWQYHGRRKGGVCNFDKLEGFCSFGGDVTIRSVKLNAAGPEGPVETSIFGTSAGLSMGLIFPVFDGPNTNEVGKLGISAGVRFYHHDTDDHTLLFGDAVDPNGTPIDFDGTFRSLNIESELEVTDVFSIRLEYFKPLNNKDVLGSVTKISFVVAKRD